MRKWMNLYFDLSKGELNGLIALFVIILLVGFFPLIWSHLAEEDTNLKGLEANIKQLEWREAEVKAHRHTYPEKHTPQMKVNLVPFDPNALTSKGWQSLGLSSKQAESIMKYVAKGGKFYKKEDVKKMYTINPQLYAQLEPFIHIEHVDASPRRVFSTSYKPKVLTIFDVNVADTNALQEIRGVGPNFARRIAKYRDRLGGFYNLRQLLEVYGLDSLKLSEILPQIRIGAGGVHLININSAGFDDLKNHPYLTYKQANAIIQYRKQHGNYSSFADLKKVVLLSPATVDNLAPYLSF
jgi:competence protein ComEA